MNERCGRTRNLIPNNCVSLAQKEEEEEKNQNFQLYRHGMAWHGMGVERKFKRVHLNHSINIIIVI